jgi:acetyl esterase
MLAPELLALLEQRKSAQLPIIGVATADELRAQTPARIALAGPVPSGVVITQCSMLTRDGALLDGHVLRPAFASHDPSPWVMFFHGGGWVHNTIDIYDASLAQLVLDTGMTVVSVNYRKAPEHPFPIPLDDCWDALMWCITHANDLRIDPLRTTVAGDSSGGNLAAAVALRARDFVPLLAQVLIYPCLDPTLSTPSSQTYAVGYGLERTAMEWYWQQYAQDHSLLTNPLVAPAHAEDVSRLPRTLIITAENDLLRDEAHDYHGRLSASGVDTSYTCYDGTIHGFFTYGSISDIPRRAIGDIAAWISTSNSPSMS